MKAMLTTSTRHTASAGFARARARICSISVRGAFLVLPVFAAARDAAAVAGMFEAGKHCSPRIDDYEFMLVRGMPRMLVHENYTPGAYLCSNVASITHRTSSSDQQYA